MAKFDRTKTTPTEYTPIEWAVYHSKAWVDKTFSKDDLIKSALWHEAGRQAQSRDGQAHAKTLGIKVPDLREQIYQAQLDELDMED